MVRAPQLKVPPPTKYCLKSEVSITLCCQVCSTRYIAVQITNYSKSTSVIKVAFMKNTDDFHYTKEAIMWYHQTTLFAVSKDEWNTKVDMG